MKTFRCTADFTFEAEDIDDALNKIQEHILFVLSDEESGYKELQFVGKLEVNPIEDVK